MRHLLHDFPDLPLTGFRTALGKNRPATLEKSAGNAPNAPDPQAVAGAVTQANQQAAIFNKLINQNNYTSPFGSQQTSITGWQNGAPIFGTNVSVNPQLQSAIDSSLGLFGGANNQYQSAMQGLSGLQGDYRSLYNQLNQGQAAAARQQGQDAAYKAQSQYLDPRFAQQETAQEARLAAQGLAPGSQAYSNAFLNFQNEKQRAYSDAANQAILTGSQIGAQDLQNQLAGIQSQAGLLGQRGNLYGQQAQLSQIPASQLRNLASLVPGYQSLANAGTTPADLAQALQNQYLGQLGQYNADQQGKNATMNSLGSLASGLLSLYGGGGGGGLFGGGAAGGGGGLFGGGGGALGTAGSALSSVAPGAAAALGDLFGASIGGTYGAATQAGLDALIGSLGGFSGGGAGAATGAAAGASGAAGGAAGAGGAGGAAGGASGAAGGLGAAAGAALPAAVIIGGVISMFQPGTQPSDISGSWAANAGNLNQSNFNQFVASDPALSGLMQIATQGGQFDYGRYEQALRSATVGGKRFEGEALQKALNFGQLVARHPEWLGGQAATQEAWWSPYAQGTPSE